MCSEIGCNYIVTEKELLENVRSKSQKNKTKQNHHYYFL